ncbi:PAR14 polymerase, partial [Cepphus grylle]|nr:PAR14 polymerase [Cepphus grylle]
AETPQEPCQVEDSQGSQPSAVVVLENVWEVVKDCMLILLVENISGLSEDDGDFSVEMVPEIRAAVVTFTGNIAAGEFAKKLNQNHRAKQQNITARCLELTRSVRAENIPPNTDSDYITVYFENKKNGGAQVVDVQQLPDEDAAIVTFSDHKDVTKILAKQHSLNKTPIFVYPYYISLGIALYGKEGPQVKKPDPITVPLDPDIWYYLQRNNSLTKAISCEMSKCNCVLTWPEPECENPKVTLHPSSALSERKRLVFRLIKTWNENVSTAFSNSISKYKAIKCQVSVEVWEAIRNGFTHDEVMIIPYISENLLVLVGEEEVVKNVEQELKLLIEKATRKIEREKQKTEEMVLMGPGEYAILQTTGLEEKICTEFPALQITYDHFQKVINLCGVAEEVYKVKGEILDNIRNMSKKTVNVHPFIFKFLEQIDNETLSQSLFMSKQISAFYELGTEAIILIGSAPEDLLKAEEEIKKQLDYKSIALEDESVLQKTEWSTLTKRNCTNEDVTVIQAESQVIITGCSQAVAKAFEELSNFIDENTQVEKVIGGKPMAVIMFFEKEKNNVWGGLQNKGVQVDFSTQKNCRVISLSGPRREVLKGATLVEQILSGLHCKRVVIREPGAKSYFKEREHFFAVTAKQDFKCLVRLEEQSEEELEEQQEHSNIGKPYGQVTIGGVVIAVYKADLCTYPVDVVVNASNEDLKEVHLVDIAQNNVQAFCKALAEVFPDSYRSLHRTSTVPQPRKRKTTENSKNFSLVTTEEGLDIILKKGSIEDATTDVVVISVTRDLQLDKGLLSKALLNKAGPMLQMSLKEEGQGKTPREGSVLKTKGYNLGCSVVLHAVVPAWSQNHASAKVLRCIITKCLRIAEELSLKSITFPAIGTGNLGFPRSVVAKLLFDEVFEFSNKNRVNSLEEVHILLHPKDTANIQANCGVWRRCTHVPLSPTSLLPSAQGLYFSPAALPGASSASAQDVHEMTIGSIVFRVAEGDITKEEADVIVNITNQTFSLKAGVSKAILNGAGRAVEDECAQLASQQNKSYITTQAGKLPCKNIIHFVAQDDIKMLVTEVLKECELQQYTSVTFPAIGTGQAGRDPAVVADNMIDAVTDFARSNSAPSVKTVKVVIFQPHLLSVFHKSMQKREKPAKTASKSLISKLTSLWSSEKPSPKVKTKVALEKKIDLVVQICGESKKEVEEAENWLKSAILKEQFQTEITDESISHFGEAESEELRNLQKKLQITLHLDSNCVRISGVGKDVWIAYSNVREMIHRVKAAEQEEIRAELFKNLIEWKYSGKDSYVPFDSLTNMRLESAFMGKQKAISVVIDKKEYIVNINDKYAVDDQGNRTPIVRVDKSEGQESTVPPATWDDMQNQRLKIVELKPETREYRDVQERFMKTCQTLKIEMIERVQNTCLWKTYQIKKHEMDIKNGNTNNERLLFHGTSRESITLINNHGFNRSYAGMHAAAFGNGTYFAVNANYSASDTYSKPDVNGKKYMYLARVLVGEYSQGTRGSITPAPKNASNSIDLFDSSTDNVKNPSMFIIFNDIQAYPEYLITFTR